MSAAVAPPLEAGWRHDGSAAYVIVLNLSSATRPNEQISLSGVDAATASVFGEDRTVPIANGVITDSFAPYAVHIYKVQEPTTVGVSPPAGLRPAARIVELAESGPRVS